MHIAEQGEGPYNKHEGSFSTGVLILKPRLQC
jgi:hypothetical protein